MSKVYKSKKSKQYRGLDARVGVLLSVEQRDWLQAHSKATGIPLTAHVRRAIDAYRQSLERNAAKRAKPAAPSSEEPVPF